MIHETNANKKILFASCPMDGHFNPLTALAVYLKEKGYDVRWYTSDIYKHKLKKLNIPFYPLKKAMDVSMDKYEEKFPSRRKIKSQTKKLVFDIINAFILRGPEYFSDIKEIHKRFSFDLLIADCAFTGSPFVKELMNIPVICVGVFPLVETSVDLPPNGLAMAPFYTMTGKMKQALLRKLARLFIFKNPNKIMYRLFDEYGVQHNRESLFDVLINKCDRFLQIGTQGFEYYRSDLSKNISFIGPLLPYHNENNPIWFDERLNRFSKIILATQGTIEKDVSKIIMPTLEAYKNEPDVLVIATTGGNKTQILKEKYPQQNFIIEDYIPFQYVMPYADVYVTNGGYGGVMLGIENKLPLVVAGLHEGKNEINARVGYFDLGINLKTERPLPRQIKSAVNAVLNNPLYKQNVNNLAEEFSLCNPLQLCEATVKELLHKPKVKHLYPKYISSYRALAMQQ
jgi:UDP:flavonoid glycosyltransferase YjiC (YdhE family)